MKVEVINDHSELNKEKNPLYWIGTVISVDNNLMLLRYCGNEDEAQDFWFDVRSKHLHPVGYSYRIRRPLVPPPGMVLKPLNTFFSFFEEFLLFFSIFRTDDEST